MFQLKNYSWRTAVTNLTDLLITSVQTVCENGLLLVCYTPHWEAPFEDLAGRIEIGGAEVRLELFSSSDGTSCHLKKEAKFEERAQDYSDPLGVTTAELWRQMFLKLSAYGTPYRNFTLSTPYCLQLDFSHDFHNDCGIRIYNMGVS